VFCGLLIAAAALTATTQAGSVRTRAEISAVPHVATAGQKAFLNIKFFNDGPSTVNHVVATVTSTSGPLPIPAVNFDLPKDGCTVAGTTSSTITCNIGQVPPGVVRRAVSFTAPSQATPFFAYVSVTFDEGKNSGLTDTVSNDDKFSFSVAASTDTSRRGTCSSADGVPTGGTLTGENVNQRTFLAYPALLLGWDPCTPASAGVDPRGNQTIGKVSKPFGDISFVELLEGSGLATVNVSFLKTPPGVTKNNITLAELASYPNSLDATTWNGSAVIPRCTIGTDGSYQLPAGSPFLSCFVGADNLPGGGVIAELRVRGGSDPGLIGSG
jgi:hypothetical protein